MEGVAGMIARWVWGVVKWRSAVNVVQWSGGCGRVVEGVADMMLGGFGGVVDVVEWSGRRG